MGYAYDPYPMIYMHIDKVAQRFKLPIVFFNSRRGEYKAPYGEIKTDELGPIEFLWLFQSAAFVVTDSFHGTAFSMIFRRPFISVIKNINGNDSRIFNLLEITETKNRAILCDNPEMQDNVFEGLSTANVVRLNEIKRQSIQFLESALRK